MNEPTAGVDESSLRDPLERPGVVASVALNIVLMAFAIALIFYQPAWMKDHPVLPEDLSYLRDLAVTALNQHSLLVLNRNRRESSIRGNSIRVSASQFPEVYAVLLDHCRRLGMRDLPELFISSASIQPYSRAFSSWRENYIVLHQIVFDIDDRKTMDVVAFLIAHELGAIRLNQTAVWNEMLLTYLSAIKWLRHPLERVPNVLARPLRRDALADRLPRAPDQRDRPPPHGPRRPRRLFRSDAHLRRLLVGIEYLFRAEATGFDATAALTASRLPLPPPRRCGDAFEALARFGRPLQTQTQIAQQLRGHGARRIHHHVPANLILRKRGHVA